ncbi:MAG: BBP7 family outer membrane beta-barrel protein [Pirellulaceae bacterium]
MKKVWFQQLAIAMGLISASTAFGQYGYNNVGASSFPVQNQGYAQPTNLQSLPQVPQNYQAQPYQMVSMQDQAGVYNLPAVPPMPPNVQPAPQYAPAPDYAQQPMAAPAQGCNTCSPMNYGYAQNLAPSCTSCGPAPVSQPAYGENYSNCGPVAYNAPSVFQGGGMGGGFGGRGHQFAGLPTGAKPWFFGGSYLLMKRIDDKNRPLALRDVDGMDVLFTGDAQMNTMNGFQVMGGRYFNCGKNAVQASYWGVFSDTEMASITGGPGDFRSRILVLGDVLSPVDQTGAANAYDTYTWYDNSYTHRVERSSEYHNIEVNLLGFAVGCASRNFNRSTAGSMFSGSRAGCGYCGGAGCGACCSAPAARFATGPTGYIAPNCGSRLNLSWLAGFRYFRFEDNLQYATSFNNDGITRAVDDLYYDVNTTNDLVGLQIGGRGDYCIGSRVNLYSTGKVGVYNNRSNLYSRLGTDTVVAYEGGMPSVNYMVDETDNRIAFLSELGAGMGLRVSQKWTATVGYQAIIASGVATSVGNVRHPRDLVRDQRYFDNTDTLILHGLQIGALYNF